MGFSAKPRTYKRVDIYNSETGTAALNSLAQMQADPKFLTLDGVSTDKEAYPDGIMPFVKKHLYYLHKHPDLDPAYYLANLRTKLRQR